VRLDEDSIDLLEVHGLGAVADRLDERSEAEILHASQNPLGRSHDEAERLCGEGGVWERATLSSSTSVGLVPAARNSK